jgi:hypothetical protein
MAVSLDRESDRPHVAHLRIDAGDLNTFTPELGDTVRETVAGVPDDVAVLTIAAPQPNDGVRGLSGGIVRLEQFADNDDEVHVAFEREVHGPPEHPVARPLTLLRPVRRPVAGPPTEVEIRDMEHSQHGGRLYRTETQLETVP